MYETPLDNIPPIGIISVVPIPPSRIQRTIDMNTQRRYSVAGMSCDHCVLSVTEEVSEITGVAGVDVELASGRLTVTGSGFADEDVRFAVAEAGYEVIA